MKVLLDIDGVCADFQGAVCELFGRPRGAITTWALAPCFGVSEVELWAKIDRAGADFWRFLEPYPWFEEMYELLKEQFEEVIFCTAPTRHPNCVAGKKWWLNDLFGDDFTGYVFTNRKELLAAPDRVLIDDCVGNIKAFSAAGGAVTLFPQRWNCRNAETMRDAWLDDLRNKSLLVRLAMSTGVSWEPD